MFKANEAENYIESLQRRAQALSDESVRSSQPQQQELYDMQRLADYQRQNNNVNMWQWVEQHPEFQQSTGQIKTLFFDWLYTQYQSNFLKWVRDNNLQEINQHVDLAISLSQNYVSPDKQFAEEKQGMLREINMLKQTVEQLLANNKIEVEAQKF